MKVTFLMAGDFDLSGGVRVVEIHARHLLARGHEVEVVPRPRRPPTLKQQVKSVFQGKGLIDNAPKTSHFTDSPVPHRRIERHRPIVAADLTDADVVIATWWETAEWVAALPPEKGAKVHFIQGYEAFTDASKPRVDAVWRMKLHKIVISRWLQELASEFGAEDVSLVLNSVDTDQFDAPPRGKQSVPTIGLLAHPLVLKGNRYSIAAIGKLLDRLPMLKLNTFGERPFENPYPDRIEHRHWQHPAQEVIRDIYARCDVWLCGSTREGFHLPPLEAMACRCPVVSTMVGGPLDIVENGKNGFLVPIGDVDALAERTHAVLSLSDADWRQMSDNAYATAKVHSWKDASISFEHALLSAVESSR